MISTAQQLRLLLEEGITRSGIQASITEAAHAAGISHQAMMNLLQGKTSNPRLQTLQSLCAFYGISLDYFACETEAACRQYLVSRHQTPLLQEITRQSETLSPKGQRNLLTLMSWMQAGKPLAQQQRKHHKNGTRSHQQP